VTNLQTSPGGVIIGTTDYPLIEADMSQILEEGESITSAECRLQTSDYTRLLKLPDAASVDGTGTIVSQKVLGSLMTVGVGYRLIWILTLSTSQVISQQTTVTVPY
jgi:hypothetical protein